jgi:hypothetical protein
MFEVYICFIKILSRSAYSLRIDILSEITMARDKECSQQRAVLAAVGTKNVAAPASLNVALAHYFTVTILYAML